MKLFSVLLTKSASIWHSTFKTEQFGEDLKKIYADLDNGSPESLTALRTFLISLDSTYRSGLLNSSTIEKKNTPGSGAYILSPMNYTYTSAMTKAKDLEAMELLISMGARHDKEYSKDVYLSDIVLENGEYKKFRGLLTIEAAQQIALIKSVTPKNTGLKFSYTLNDKGLLKKLCMSYGYKLRDGTLNEEVLECVKDFFQLELVTPEALSERRFTMLLFNLNRALILRDLSEEKIKNLISITHFLLDNGADVNATFSSKHYPAETPPTILFPIICTDQNTLFADFLLNYYKDDLSQLNKFQEQLKPYPDRKIGNQSAIEVLNYCIERLTLKSEVIKVDKSSTTNAAPKKSFKL